MLKLNPLRNFENRIIFYKMANSKKLTTFSDKIIIISEYLLFF